MKYNNSNSPFFQPEDNFGSLSSTSQINDSFVPVIDTSTAGAISLNNSYLDHSSNAGGYRGSLGFEGVVNDYSTAGAASYVAMNLSGLSYIDPVNIASYSGEISRTSLSGSREMMFDNRGNVTCSGVVAWSFVFVLGAIFGIALYWGWTHADATSQHLIIEGAKSVFLYVGSKVDRLLNSVLDSSGGLLTGVFIGKKLKSI